MALRKRRKFKYSVGSEEMIKHSEHGRTTTWTSSNGNQVSVMDMDSNHIKNAIAKIERGELMLRENMIPILKMELIYRQLYTKSDNN